MGNMTVDNGEGGHIRRGTGVLPDGTPIAVGEHRVKAGGGRNFLSSAITELGIDDAMVVREKARGNPVPRPYWQLFEESQKRLQARAEAERREKLHLSAQTPAGEAREQTPGEKLGMLLAAADGDEEMQLLILKKWNAKYGSKAAAAPAPATPDPAAEPIEA